MHKERWGVKSDWFEEQYMYTFQFSAGKKSADKRRGERQNVPPFTRVGPKTDRPKNPEQISYS